MVDQRQVVFTQTRHFHDGIAFNAVLQHGTGNFQLVFIPTFLNTTLLAELNPLLDALLFKLLCDGHKCLRVAAHAVPVRVQRLQRQIFRLTVRYSVPAISPKISGELNWLSWPTSSARSGVQ